SVFVGLTGGGVCYAPTPFEQMKEALSRESWLIYGANGYSGRIIAEEAKRRGLQPSLGGRDLDSVERVADDLQLGKKIFDLSNAGAIRRAIKGSKLVLNCAGPFVETAQPLLDACLDMGIHYLDITGEIDVFAACHARDGEAKQRRIVVA